MSRPSHSLNPFLAVAGRGAKRPDAAHVLHSSQGAVALQREPPPDLMQSFF